MLSAQKPDITFELSKVLKERQKSTHTTTTTTATNPCILNPRGDVLTVHFKKMICILRSSLENEIESVINPLLD